MLSGGATNFGQGCLHTLLSNMYWRGAWRRVMVLRERRAWQNPSDLFGICQDLTALKWTLRCSNWHQSHIRIVNNTKTYHRQGKQGALLIQKSWWHSLDRDLRLMQIPHFGTSRPESQSYNYWHTCGNRCRQWRSPDRPCLLFQRLIISGSQANDLVNALTQELCNYPQLCWKERMDSTTCWWYMVWSTTITTTESDFQIRT